MTLRARATRSRTSFVLNDGTVLTFDAMVSEAPTYAGRLTDHPIEGGGSVADHYTHEPDTLSLELYATNDRLASDIEPEGTTRDFDAFARLKAIKQSRLPVRVVTALDVYAPMVVERLSTTRTGAGGQALRMQVDLKRAVFATTQTVEVPESLRSLRSQRAESEKQIGQADAQSVGDVASATGTSAAATGSSGGAASSETAARGAREPQQTPEQSATAKRETSLLNQWF